MPPDFKLLLFRLWGQSVNVLASLETCIGHALPSLEPLCYQGRTEVWQAGSFEGYNPLVRENIWSTCQSLFQRATKWKNKRCNFSAVHFQLIWKRQWLLIWSPRCELGVLCNRPWRWIWPIFLSRCPRFFPAHDWSGWFEVSQTKRVEAR